MSAGVWPVARSWPAGFAGEVGKVFAFLRRDFLIAWSYRQAFLSDLLGLVVQSVLFYFVSLMVDPARIPQFGGQRTSYMAFVAVGIAMSMLLGVGIGRMTTALRHEQLTGTLETLLMTPTSPTTIQVGLVVYDLVQVPIRMAVFLGLAAAAFGVDIRVSGIGPALAIVFVFFPFLWGLGALSAAAVLTFRQVTGALGLVSLALTVGSGAYFPLDLLPGWLAATARFNPVALALAGLRGTLLGGAGWEAVRPLILLIAPISVASLAIGIVAFRLALRRERRAGTLGLY